MGKNFLFRIFSNFFYLFAKKATIISKILVNFDKTFSKFFCGSFCKNFRGNKHFRENKFSFAFRENEKICFRFNPSHNSWKT
jgi:hypothetical protein